MKLYTFTLFLIANFYFKLFTKHSVLLCKLVVLRYLTISLLSDNIYVQKIAFTLLESSKLEHSIAKFPPIHVTTIWAYLAQNILGIFCPSFGQNLPKITFWTYFAKTFWVYFAQTLGKICPKSHFGQNLPKLGQILPKHIPDMSWANFAQKYFYAIQKNIALMLQLPTGINTIYKFRQLLSRSAVQHYFLWSYSSINLRLGKICPNSTLSKWLSRACRRCVWRVIFVKILVIYFQLVQAGLKRTYTPL